MIAALTFVRALPLRSWLIVGAVAGIFALGVWLYSAGRGDEREATDAKAVKVERQASTGRETAAGERLDDQASLNQQRKATDDALSPLPDAVPSDRRVVRHCLRLQRDGFDTSRFPECR